jgi:glutathione peroxidase-family protein
MEIFKQLNKKGYKHYYEGTVEELDSMDKDNQHLHSEIMQVIMWLYEKHGIWIHSAPENNEEDIVKWAFTIQTIDTEVRFVRRFSDFNSPTEAYESAIEYTLKNLI